MTKCICGHAKDQHIYGGGKCRPGYICGSRCNSFTEYKDDAIKDLGTCTVCHEALIEHPEGQDYKMVLDLFMSMTKMHAKCLPGDTGG